EIEGIRGCWSVPQLKRQIESLLYERTALSTNKSGLVDSVQNQKKAMTVDQIIRDPYILEFTGFPEKYEFSENELEGRLLDNIQMFLLELGNGFCLRLVRKVLHFLCSLQIAREVWNIYPTNLKNVCDVLSIQLDHHNPESDAVACAEILILAAKKTLV
ncbi:MAG TPA: PDDEXK nuclease domain-containing protein, partial [Chitinispirillaceae bacterium]|nr:PDDEXK nuclease domain-containing protein [Chitinispirillaceae bacterium]